MSADRVSPDRKTIFVGKTICRLVAVAPWTWPVVRGAVGRFFDQAATGWDERTEAGSPEHLATLAGGLDAIPARPERVLDLGCGTGAGTLFLAREFPTASVRGLDLSPEMIAKAQAKIGLDPDARVSFRSGDASSLPYGDNSFDLVAQINMPVFFREIERVLRPGGGLVIASSLGDSTPFSTPEKLVRRKLASHGFDHVYSGAASEGTWVAATLEEPR
ncbi:MAG: class I SAM-dependent methyltransferase [Solirubrobacterales bacterium]|nr:class I SAM-dependent methyltransferase [Solirubrobacterales bacterium]